MVEFDNKLRDVAFMLLEFGEELGHVGVFL